MMLPRRLIAIRKIRVRFEVMQEYSRRMESVAGQEYYTKTGSPYGKNRKTVKP